MLRVHAGFCRRALGGFSEFSLWRALHSAWPTCRTISVTLTLTLTWTLTLMLTLTLTLT